jgi:hypothetical protein
MQGTLRVQIVTRTQNALSLIDKLRGRGKRIISALPGDPRPQVIKILYPSRASSPLEVSICSLQRGSRTRLQILPILISPTRITPGVIPPKSPTRFPIFFLRKFISQFRSHALCSPPYCFNGSLPNRPIFNISLIWIFSQGRTTRSTVTDAPPLEEDRQSLHVLDKSSVIILTLYSTQQSG